MVIKEEQFVKMHDWNFLTSNLGLGICDLGFFLLTIKFIIMSERWMVRHGEIQFVNCIRNTVQSANFI
jgi:hypothetical protein